MNEPVDNAGAPRSTQNAENSVCRLAWVRKYSVRNASQPERSATGYPEKTGGRPGSCSSRGLHETIRAQGRPLAWIAGKQTTLSSTISDGCTSSKISRNRSST